MLVCAHGNVSAYCKAHDMVIVEEYSGAIEEYSGTARVMVTDKEMAQAEYYILKGKMLARGVELVSIHYTDDALIADVLAYTSKRRKKYGDFTKPKEEGYVPGKHVRGSFRDGNYQRTQEIGRNQKIVGVVTMILLFAVVFLLLKYFPVLMDSLTK